MACFLLRNAEVAILCQASLRLQVPSKIISKHIANQNYMRPSPDHVTSEHLVRHEVLKRISWLAVLSQRD